MRRVALFMLMFGLFVGSSTGRATGFLKNAYGRSGSSLAADASSGGQAKTLATVHTAMFGAQAPLPILIGQSKGLFEKFGVRVVPEPRWTSEELRAGLASGAFQVVHSLVDNAIAVAEINKVPTIVIFGAGGGSGGGGGESGGQSELVAQPHIKTAEDLKGTTLLVDSPDTAMALVLRKILRLKGLELHRDYEIKAFAQTQKRFEEMKANKNYTATMMGLNAEARSLGFHSLGSIKEAIGAYQGTSVYVTRKWAEANPDAVVGYLAGWMAAQRWLRDPANKAEVIKELAKSSDPEAAARTYERSYTGADPTRDPGFSVEGFKNTLKLRAEIEGTWGGTPPPPERYFDLSYYQKALALLDK